MNHFIPSFAKWHKDGGMLASYATLYMMPTCFFLLVPKQMTFQLTEILYLDILRHKVAQGVYSAGALIKLAL